MVIGGAAAAGNIWITAVFVFGAVLTILYLLRAFTSVFLGPVKTADAREGSPLMVGSVVALTVLAVLSGIFVNIPSQFVNLIVSQLGAS